MAKFTPMQQVIRPLSRPALRPPPPPGLGGILAQAGPLTVKLADDSEEVAEAQALRFRVFYREMAATATPMMAALERDVDQFDAHCDHLVVIDANRPSGDRVVGTYRLLREEAQARIGRWYSADEFAIGSVIERRSDHGGLLELGRSCVHPDYRTTATIQLLWRGITAYVHAHDIGTMFGCASLAGTDPDQLAAPLAFLHHHHRAPADWRVAPLPHRAIAMDRLAADDFDLRRTLGQLPPLVKAYLRLGAYIGDGAVIDHDFGTTDVFILLPVERIPPKYLMRFERD